MPIRVIESHFLTDYRCKTAFNSTIDNQRKATPAIGLHSFDKRILTGNGKSMQGP
jgi:hypothetical protein